MHIVLSPYFGPGVILVLSGILIFMGVRRLRNSVPVTTSPKPQSRADLMVSRGLVYEVRRPTVEKSRIVRHYPAKANVSLGGRWKTLPVVGGNRRGLFVESSCGTVFRKKSQIRVAV